VPVTRTLQLLTIALILVVCVVSDQVVKVLAWQTLAGQPPIYLLGGLLRLQYAENTGAFLSLGANLPETTRGLLLGLFVFVILVAATVYLVRNPNLPWPQWLGLALLIGGGLGNLLDRVFRGGKVADFAVLSLGPLSTGIFNIADVFIMAGIALFAISVLSAPKTPTPAHG
jgi:signal peptidase II